MPHGNSAKRSLLVDEFIAREADRGRIRREAFTQESREIRLHGHCHQKSLALAHSDGESSRVASQL